MAETDKVNLITAGSRFDGVVEFSDYTRFEGYIQGTLRGREGSQVILGENGVVEGKIEGDVVVVDGFVRGDIVATGKVVISETGRVIGQVTTPSFAVKFGGFFEGKCEMSAVPPSFRALEKGNA